MKNKCNIVSATFKILTNPAHFFSYIRSYLLHADVSSRLVQLLNVSWLYVTVYATYSNEHAIK